MISERMNAVITTSLVLCNVYHTTAFSRPPSRPLHLQHRINGSTILHAKEESNRAFGASASSPSADPNIGRDLVKRGVSAMDKDSLIESVTSLDSSSPSPSGNAFLEVDAESITINLAEEQGPMKAVSSFLSEKIGTIDESRLAFPEIVSGEVPRMFSNINYKKDKDTDNKIATHASGSVTSAALLVSGTTIGAGILALPTATAPAGFLASSFALGIAWLYMTISGLLIAELSINRLGETGKQGVGLLEIYNTYLGKNLGYVGSAAYFFLHYAVMVAYLAQGGSNLGSLFDSVGLESLAAIPGLDQLFFAGAVGSLVYFSSPNAVEKINNALVGSVIASFLGIIAFGAGSADFGALIAAENQHPELVVSAFPILFLSMVYHNVVPTVVTTLEADRMKITKALCIGTTIPFIMFLAWNAIILGNVVTIPGASFGDGMTTPIELLQSEGIGGETLGNLVSVFSELAITTSLIGFIFGLIDGLTDVVNLPTKGRDFEKWKPALFAGTLVPPLLLSLGNPDIFYDALDYGGAFGVSTLFLVLPPLMVWKVRYGDEKKELSVPPMVPFGKIPLGSLWKAAATLIFEQGAEKLGVFEFIQETFNL